MEALVLISGSGNRPLSAEVARLLAVPIAHCEIGRFPDGEVSVALLEPVRGHNVFVLQTLSPPVDEHLLELLAVVDACRRASAARVIAVIPYLAYSRSDKRHREGEPIMASVIASMLQQAGVDHLITVDLHTAQIEGFFHIPVDILSAIPLLCHRLKSLIPEDTIVISPDEGRVKASTLCGQLLGLPLGIIHKERSGGAITSVRNVIGNVRGKACLILDDMISTGGTLAGAITALLAAGARPEMFIAATHALLLRGAAERLSSEAVSQVIVTNTIDQGARISPRPRIHALSIAPLLAECIGRIAESGKSLTS